MDFPGPYPTFTSTPPRSPVYENTNHRRVLIPVGEQTFSPLYELTNHRRFLRSPVPVGEQTFSPVYENSNHRRVLQSPVPVGEQTFSPVYENSNHRSVVRRLIPVCEQTFSPLYEITNHRRVQRSPVPVGEQTFYVPVRQIPINLRPMLGAQGTNGEEQPQAPFVPVPNPQVQHAPIFAVPNPQVHQLAPEQNHEVHQVPFVPVPNPLVQQLSIIPQRNAPNIQTTPTVVRCTRLDPAVQFSDLHVQNDEERNAVGACSFLRQVADPLKIATLPPSCDNQVVVLRENGHVEFGKLVELFPNIDIDFLRQEYLRRAGDEEAMNIFISELLDNNKSDDFQGQNLVDNNIFKQYKKLTDAFPDADPDFLWNKCVLFPDDESIQEFIARTRRQNNYPKQTGHLIIERHFEELLRSFPDADPHFLWQKCEEMAGNEDEMRCFINKISRDRNYPRHSDGDKEQLDSQVTELQYQKLLELFPDAEPEYLWEQCKLRARDPENFEEFIIQTIREGKYPRSSDIPIPKPSIEGVDEALQGVVDIQYRHLLEVLPNADPTYLLDNVKKMAGDENSLQAFMAEALEKENYPTMEHHLQTQKANELQKKYIEEFYPSEFMAIFSDPWNYFLNEKPGNKDPCPLAVEYLQRRYLDLHSWDIEAVYKENSYSIARTCKALDTKYPKERESRTDILFGFSELTVPFVQEVSFVENEPALKQYQTFKKKIRERSLIRAREVGTLLECACCYNDELLPEDVTTCSSGHLFCVDCVTRGAEVIIGDGKISFPCYLSDECKGEFSLPTLQSVLKPTVFSNLLLRKQMIEVTEAGVSDIETCPFCDFVTMKPSDDIKIFSCRNPQCMKDSCRLCKEPSHVPYRCNEVEKPEEVQMRTYIEDKMTEALVRECYKCKRKFIKQDGCNKMTCQCGAMMCYICRQPVKSYDHFSDRNAAGRCPLWSNNEELHVNQVMNVGRRVRDEVLATHPDYELKNDPTLIPPK